MEKFEVIDKPLKEKYWTHPELAKEIRRFAKEVGEKPRYESDLNAPERQSERLLKAKREAEGIKEKYQEFLDIKLNLKLAIEKWVNSYKYEELSNLKQDLELIEIDLK